MPSQPSAIGAARVSPAFSPTVLKALARQKLGDAASRVALLIDPALAHITPLADAFDLAHRQLVDNYQNEYAFKNQIITKIIFGRHSPSTTTAILEQPMSSSIADLVLLNGTSTTYEVKTDLDTFSRLEAQLSDYAKHSEYVYVVVSERRFSSARRHLSETAGLLALRRNGSLAVVRPATSNLTQMQSRDLFRLLRTSEATAALQRLSDYQPTVAPGHMREEMRSLFEALPVGIAHAELVIALKSRARVATQLVTSAGFPRSLRALAYSTELSNTGAERVVERLTWPVSEVLAAI